MFDKPYILRRARPDSRGAYRGGIALSTGASPLNTTG